MTTKRERKYSQDFSGETVVQQHFKQSCDVNNIVAQYQATGIDVHADRINRQTFGFASSKSYEQAAREIAEIGSAFADLPSSERSRFANDPARWIDELTTPVETPDAIVAPEALETPSEPAPEPTKTEPLDII